MRQNEKKTPRTKTPRTKAPDPAEPIFRDVPAMVKPTIVVESFADLVGRIPAKAVYEDDLYRGVRGFRVLAKTDPRRADIQRPRGVEVHPGGIRTQPAVGDLEPGTVVAWMIHGKPLKPVIVVITSALELRTALVRCGKAPLLPSRMTGSRFIEAVAHLPKQGKALVLRIPQDVFETLPTKLASRVYARDLRNRLLGRYVRHWHAGDPVMLQPFWMDRRFTLAAVQHRDDSFEQVVAALGTQTAPAVSPTAPDVLPSRQPSDWVLDPNAPEHEFMKWDLTLLDVAYDFGLRAAFRILSDTARTHGWGAVLNNPTTLFGLARWRRRKEIRLFYTIVAMYPEIRKHAKRLSDALNHGKGLFDSAKRVAERVASTP